MISIKKVKMLQIWMLANFVFHSGFDCGGLPANCVSIIITIASAVA